jgi:hypothetical protein
MSIINSDGLNANWQLNVLRGLQGINDLLSNLHTCCPPQSRTPIIIYETHLGTIPIVTYGFSIANVGAAPGLVNGQILDTGVTINFDPGVNNTIGGLPYDPTGTAFLITYIL